MIDDHRVQQMAREYGINPSVARRLLENARDVPALRIGQRIGKIEKIQTGKLLHNFLGGQGERRKRDEKSVPGTLLDKQKNPGKHLG